MYGNWPPGTDHASRIEPHSIVPFRHYYKSAPRMLVFQRVANGRLGVFSVLPDANENLSGNILVFICVIPIVSVRHKVLGFFLALAWDRQFQWLQRRPRSRVLTFHCIGPVQYSFNRPKSWWGAATLQARQRRLREFFLEAIGNKRVD